MWAIGYSETFGRHRVAMQGHLIDSFAKMTVRKVVLSLSVHSVHYDGEIGRGC